MATEIFANNIKTTLVSAIAAYDTSILVYYADFPDIGGETTNYSRAVITSGTAPGSAYEYLVVDQTFYESGMVTLEVQRGQEGSVGFDWPAGSILYLAATAASFTDLQSGGEASLIGRTDSTFPGATMLGDLTPLDAVDIPSCVFIGSMSGRDITASSYTTCVGSQSGSGAGGDNNTAIGAKTLRSGSGNNTAVGFSAMGGTDISTSVNCIAVGINALYKGRGNDNIAIGYYSQQYNFTGSNNISIGYSSLEGNYETFPGNGSNNVAIGDYTLYSSTNTSQNTVIGHSSLRNASSASYNFAGGYHAAYSGTSCSYNVSVGHRAMYANTVGGYNVAIGANALDSATGCSETVAIGYNTLQAANSSQYNTAIGWNAMSSSTYGNYNTAIGADVMAVSTSGAYNAVIGYQSMVANTTGSMNTAIGTYSLGQNTNGSYNVALGVHSLENNSTGSRNIGIGGWNGSAYAPAFNITTQSNYAYFGSTSLTNAYIQVAWTVNSDLRNKIVHSAVPHGLDFVNSLLPIKYQFKEDRESEVAVGPIRYGFGAQDILALEGENPVIIDNSEEENLRFNESSLIPILVKAIQELTAEVQALKTKVG